MSTRYPRWWRHVRYIHNPHSIEGCSVSIPELAADTILIDGFGVAKRAIYNYLEPDSRRASVMELRSALLIRRSLDRLLDVQLKLEDFDVDGLLR